MSKENKINYVEELKILHDSIKTKLDILAEYIKSNNLNDKISEYELRSQDVNLWENQNYAAKILTELKHMQTFINNYTKYSIDYSNSFDLTNVYKDDEEIIKEIYATIQDLYATINEMYITTLFSDPNDDCECFIEITAGSGGLEAQDWASILFAMYINYIKGSKNYKCEVMDYSDGEGGLKSGLIKVIGTPKSFPYGMLKCEHGIHRLVRPSPFNANNNRHTSFSSVSITPVLDDGIDLKILETDLRIDTYRSSGAGGQHVNKTDSAVRITHIPTGIVAQCQNDRSQHKNKAEAMKILRSRLYVLEEEKRKNETSVEKNSITWGNQIRSYILDDSRIKDLRTYHESTQPNKVLAGDLQPFLDAYIKYTSQQKR